MTPAQCRAARAWLAWTQADLARRAMVSRDTIRLFENVPDHKLQAETEERIVCTFLGFGVKLTENGMVAI